jgi:hypothetical protein
MKQICEICGAIIERPMIAYHLRVELFADPTPPSFTEDDLAGDFKAEIVDLIKALEKTDPEESEAEVYESYLFTLCPKCRQKMHQWLKKENHLFSDDPDLKIDD